MVSCMNSNSLNPRPGWRPTSHSCNNMNSLRQGPRLRVESCNLLAADLHLVILLEELHWHWRSSPRHHARASSPMKLLGADEAARRHRSSSRQCLPSRHRDAQPSGRRCPASWPQPLAPYGQAHRWTVKD